MSTHRIDRNVWVGRSPSAAYEAWTHLDLLPQLVGPGESPVVDELAPGQRIRWHGSRDRSSGATTFTGVTRTTTAVTVHLEHHAETRRERLQALLGVPTRRVQRVLDVLRRVAESRPDSVDGRQRGSRPGGEPPTQPAIGVPRQSGVVDAASRSDGSPGGTGSMGVTSDDPAVGGRVGPADISGVPPTSRRR